MHRIHGLLPHCSSRWQYQVLLLPRPWHSQYHTQSGLVPRTHTLCAPPPLVQASHTAASAKEELGELFMGSDVSYSASWWPAAYLEGHGPLREGTLGHTTENDTLVLAGMHCGQTWSGRTPLMFMARAPSCICNCME